MEFVFKLVTFWTIATLSSAQLNYNNPIFIPEYIQTQSSVVAAVQEPPTEESANVNIQQLPNPEIAQPFFTRESQPSTYLKAPTEDASISNFNVQLPNAPSQDLQLPSLVKWNPNDDPNLYYPVIVDKIVPLNIPTSQYPKKYNKNVQKVKPSGFKPKDVVLIEDLLGQKDVDKALYNLAKQENKKLLELEAEAQAQAQASQVKDAVPAESVYGGFSPSNSFSHGFGSTPTHSSSSSSGGLSSSLNSGHHYGNGGDRMEFQIRGHDGPKSYKWGYDTGKGKNRHFRYEEKDKHGVVKGHYGYYDKHGKLRMVHYDSHPHEGFHASDGDTGLGPNY